MNLTQGNILKSLISFAFPILLALFLQVMYGAVDLIIVGQIVLCVVAYHAYKRKIKINASGSGY